MGFLRKDKIVIKVPKRKGFLEKREDNDMATCCIRCTDRIAKEAGRIVDGVAMKYNPETGFCICPYCGYWFYGNCWSKEKGSYPSSRKGSNGQAKEVDGKWVV